MSAIAAAVVVGATTIYAANKASGAAKAAAASQAEAAKGLANSADYAADMSYKLGNDQLSFAKQQYEDMKPLAQRVSEQQIAAQQQQMTQAQDYYKYQTDTFRPLEQGLVKSAQEYNTEGNRQLLASQAAADAQTAFAGVQSQSNREMARRGINPSSGAALMLRNQNAMSLAGLTAGASNNARRQAEATGYSRLTDAANIGRGLAASSLSAYGGSVSAGTAGVNTAMAPGNQYTSAVTPAFNTMVAGAGQQVTGYSNLYSGATSSANAAAANELNLYGSVVGMAGGLVARGAGMGKFP
jgi:hypothetical protein